MSFTILIVDDEENARRNYTDFLEAKGYEVMGAATLGEARKILPSGEVDIVLLDVNLPDGYGPNLLYETAHMPNKPLIIMITAYGDIEMAVDAMKTGAHDFLTKPIEFSRLEQSILRATEQITMKRELAHYRQSEQKKAEFVVGKNPKMQALVSQAQRAAAMSVSVLITGETGTGKEVLARFIHQSGPRAKKSFIAINCAAIQSTVLESELFGYEKGDFTGADKGGKPGKFEIANKGTIFLDEIGDMPLHLQVKLLHAIQNRQIDRIGGISPIDVDVRIIAATNKDLDAMIKMKEFREDLYFRLNVIPLNIPPLRSRPGDTELLLNYALQKFTDLLNKSIEGFSGEAIELLMRYDWPGNVRELENVVEYAVNMETDSQISAGNLPDRVCRVDGGRFERSGGLKEKMDRYQKQLIGACLIDTGYSLEGKIRAAGILGISESTLYRRIRELGIVEK